jgi:hypothetical protein
MTVDTNNINIPLYIVNNIKYFYNNYEDKEIIYRSLSLKDYYEKEELRGLDKIVKINLDKNIEKRKRVIIDIKIKSYKKEEKTCQISRWHLDGGRKERIYRENIYYIFCINAPTEFLDIKSNKLKFIKTLGNNIIAKNFIKKIPSNCWYRYGEKDYHRGPKIMQDLHRIWIRITYSDYIKTIKQ